MSQYKNVKIALRKFLVENMGLDGSQIFRAPPKPTSITKFPAIIIRSATTTKIGEGPIYNDHSIILGIMTRGGSSETISDEIDDLLALLDQKIHELGVTGLDQTLASPGRWNLFSRVDQQTQFDNIVEEDVGTVVYGARAGVLIREQLNRMSG